jgi:GIY-YIG catalytic domain
MACTRFSGTPLAAKAPSSPHALGPRNGEIPSTSTHLKRDPRFDDFRDRLIIDWGPGALAWVQNIKNKRVLEILAPGRTLAPFVDYLEFSLTHAELKDLFKNEEAHKDWKSALSAVAGVYLILAQASGKLYIGSASGATGIWGRWRNYAKSGHGKNVKLRALIERDSSYPEQFRFSVLQILPKTLTRDEVVQRETLYKLKLGTRAKGLNS